MGWLSHRTTESLEREREQLDEQVRALNESIREINSELFRRTEDYVRMFDQRGQRSTKERADG